MVRKKKNLASLLSGRVFDARLDSFLVPSCRIPRVLFSRQLTGNTSQVNQEQVEVLTGAVYYALARILLPESRRGTRSPWERNRERRVVRFIQISSCIPTVPPLHSPESDQQAATRLWQCGVASTRFAQSQLVRPSN